MRRHVPGRRDGPVAAVVELGGDVGDALRLVLRQGRGRRDRGDLAGAVPAVVAECGRCRSCSRGVGVDLEVDPLPDVDADVGREALDRRVAGAVDVPDVLGRCPACCSRRRSCCRSAARVDRRAVAVDPASPRPSGRRQGRSATTRGRDGQTRDAPDGAATRGRLRRTGVSSFVSGRLETGSATRALVPQPGGEVAGAHGAARRQRATQPDRRGRQREPEAERGARGPAIRASAAGVVPLRCRIPRRRPGCCRWRPGRAGGGGPHVRGGRTTTVPRRRPGTRRPNASTRRGRRSSPGQRIAPGAGPRRRGRTRPGRRARAAPGAAAPTPRSRQRTAHAQPVVGCTRGGAAARRPSRRSRGPARGRRPRERDVGVEVDPGEDRGRPLPTVTARAFEGSAISITRAPAPSGRRRRCRPCSRCRRRRPRGCPARRRPAGPQVRSMTCASSWAGITTTQSAASRPAP